MHSIVTTFREAVIKVEVANFGAAMDTLIDQDGLTPINTWVLNYFVETNEKFPLHSTQYIRGRKWEKICKVGVGSNAHTNFI